MFMRKFERFRRELQATIAGGFFGLERSLRFAIAKENGEVPPDESDAMVGVIPTPEEHLEHVETLVKRDLDQFEEAIREEQAETLRRFYRPCRSN